MKNLERLYGISIAEYEALRVTQDYKCAICTKHESEINTRGKTDERRYRMLVIDHCHTMNKVRGLLCHDCNVMLGNSKDSIETLKAAISYLAQSA